MTCDSSWGDDLDFLRRRHLHVELGGGDTLDKRLRGPGALLELQLAPLDFQVIPASVQLLELDEHLTCAVFAVNRTRGRAEGSDPENRNNEKEHFAAEEVHAV